MSRNNYNNNNKSIVTYICYIILAIVLLLVILTIFNMDLFMSYFNNLGQSKSFGAFIARFGDYVLALLRHTFRL